MAVDAFLKFDGFGGEGQKLGNDFDRLGDSFTDLGGAFIKLVDDGASTDTNSHKADFAAQIKHDVFEIGANFFKVGDAFIKLAGPLDAFADAVVKFTDQFKVTPSDSTDQPSLAADFLTFENDIKFTGADFLAAGSEIKSDAPSESLSLNFSKISVDYKQQGSDALQIATDLAEFVRVNKLSDSPVGEAFLKFSDEWKIVAGDYSQLGMDFATITKDAGDGGPVTFDHVHKLAGDFTVLNQDLKLADTALTTLGGDFHKLADAINDAGPVTTPSVKLG